MEKLVVNNYGSFDLTFVKGKSATMWDINGRKYIDFISGIGVNCLGHNYKPLVKAISKQAKKQIHVCNYFVSDVGVEYATELLGITGYDAVYFGNSGAEGYRPESGALLSRSDLEALLDPQLYIGRCANQVSAYLAKLAPLLEEIEDDAPEISV